ncbi:glycosyl transferase family 1, partial [filamentous cyanobacterium CCP5]
MNILETYAQITGEAVIAHLQQLAAPLQGKQVLHINSTAVGGGVAEILTRFVPLMRELGIDATWEVISGDEPFYACTKKMHNGLQGDTVSISESHLQHYQEVNAENAAQLRDRLESADFVFIHDPQP